jgi:hypothetical protein
VRPLLSSFGQWLEEVLEKAKQSLWRNDTAGMYSVE